MSCCNHCHYQNIKDKARVEKNKVSVLHDAKWGMGGVNVYVHPKNININELPGGEDDKRKQYRVAWFMELPDGCCC